MNREDLIHLAKEAGFKESDWMIFSHVIEKFASLVAEKARHEYDQSALGFCKDCGWKAVWPDGCLVCAEAIRARGE